MNISKSISIFGITVVKWGVVLGFALVFAFSIHTAWALWSDPGCDPDVDPGPCNTPTPINVGDTAQTKIAPLTIDLSAAPSERDALFLIVDSSQPFAAQVVNNDWVAFYSSIGGGHFSDLHVRNIYSDGGGISTFDGTTTAGDIEANRFCLGNGVNCISTWPVGGGGTVTDIFAGSGLTASPDPIKIIGTLNVGAGTGISVLANSVGLAYPSKSCGAGEAIRSFNLGSSSAPTCSAVGAGGLTDAFVATQVPLGTSPTAQGADTLVFATGGAGISISGNSSTDTITFTNTGDTNASDDITGVSGTSPINVSGPNSNRTVSINSCGSNQILKWNGSSWACATDNTGSGVGGSGTDNYIPRWNGTSALENSVIYQDTSGDIEIGGSSPGAGLRLDVAGYAGVRRTATDWLYLAAPAILFDTGADFSIGTRATYDSGGWTSRLRIDGATGNVGIPSVNSSYKLNVDSSTGTAIRAIGQFTGIYAVGANIAIYGDGSGTGVYGRAIPDTAGVQTGVQGEGANWDFYAQGAGIDYGSSSSIRWKKNVETIENALEKVLSLRGVYFDWNEDKGGHRDVGFIAEEMDLVLPELVGYDEEGKPTAIDYGRTTPLLLQAIKELYEENEKLRERVEALEVK